uniref:C2 domain-containing protein n=1 Tax=Gadus morhua TaxID=8049 RepID=A0A8C4ZPB0_GADMO
MNRRMGGSIVKCFECPLVRKALCNCSPFTFTAMHLDMYYFNIVEDHVSPFPAPVPMEEIERMAALCMKDLDEDDVGEEDLDDEDLLAELNEVLEEVEEEAPRPAPPVTMVTAPQPRPPPGGASGPESVLLERIAMYQAAVANATASGETSKARRYDRGLKTLQSMLASVKKGKPINEEDMPPPVATGGKPNVPPPQPEPIKEREQPAPNLMPSLPTNQKPLREAPPVIPNVKPHSLTPPKAASTALTPGTPAISPLTPGHTHSQHSELKQAVLSRQRDYKMAAIHAKQGGDSELAKQHYLIAKVTLDPVLEALDRGEPLDLRSLPPAPELAAPGSVEEALTQRMDRYKAAATTAKSTGDERKSRMHQRIVKQYQDSIKAHKAGRPVNLSELPVPPGCPPLQGLDVGQQNFMGVMETAMKLANQEADVEEDSHADAAKSLCRSPSLPAQQQLDFLLLRRQGLTNAALRSKQMKDLQGATQHLRHAKGLDAMITAARAGLPVDISQVPDAPVFEEAFSLGRPRTPLSPRSGAQYQQLMELLRKQHQKCRGYCKQFTQIGNLAETLKCERLAEECMKSVEVLKRAHAQGHGAPRARHEERTLNVIRVNPDLSMNDMMLHIIRGINLPTPSGVSSSDLDSSVKFEFPFPSVEEAQCDRTATVRSTSSPEFNESFRLSINRGHRVFRRLSKGIRLEVLHKGGLFKTDKVVGGAQLKMDALENQCEVREILEVLDGRRPTGGKLEVRLQLREPLGGAQLQAVTEKWLVLEPPPPSPTKRPKDRKIQFTFKQNGHEIYCFFRHVEIHVLLLWFYGTPPPIPCVLLLCVLLLCVLLLCVLLLCVLLLWSYSDPSVFCCSVFCCSVLCCSVFCCSVFCCSVFCCSVFCCSVFCCSVFCCSGLTVTPLCSVALCSVALVLQ